jgi:hypothetical protein
VVQVIGVAMQAGVRYPSVRDALPIHPTVSEFFPTILAALQPLDDEDAEPEQAPSTTPSPAG